MTVAELIAKLQTMPQDAPVVIDMCSECLLLDEEEPRLEEMIVRHGTWMKLNKSWWDYAKDGEPNQIAVCHFPGN
jgi:hypothetical protein